MNKLKRMKPTPNNFTTFCSENSHIDDNKKKTIQNERRQNLFLFYLR
uniref:GM10858p n=1 Tax=Drosophila melanogaster TaxID=7227 RepID=Q8T944_DROME|nr:GM10858p [Drosophila melanogaster]